MHEILQAWVKLKTNKNINIANISENDPNFRSRMTHMLTKIKNKKNVKQSCVEMVTSDSREPPELYNNINVLRIHDMTPSNSLLFIGNAVITEEEKSYVEIQVSKNDKKVIINHDSAVNVMFAENKNEETEIKTEEKKDDGNDNDYLNMNILMNFVTNLKNEHYLRSSQLNAEETTTIVELQPVLLSSPNILGTNNLKSGANIEPVLIPSRNFMPLVVNELKRSEFINNDRFDFNNEMPAINLNPQIPPAYESLASLTGSSPPPRDSIASASAFQLCVPYQQNKSRNSSLDRKMSNKIFLNDNAIAKMYVELSHPNISALYHQGYGEKCIKQAYYILKRKKKREHIKLTADLPTFVEDMLEIMVEYEIEPKNAIGKYNRFDILWRNIICCFWCKFVHCEYCNKKEPEIKKIKTPDEEYYGKLAFTKTDDFFYLQVYLFLVTDFYVRIYPPMLFAVSFNNFKYYYAMAAFYTVLEYISYYYVLVGGEFKTFTSALKYFWVGFYSCSYSFLSAMHLTYLPCNVHFGRLMRIQWMRMLLQVSFMIGLFIFRRMWNNVTDIGQDFLLMTACFILAFIINCAFIGSISKTMKLFESKIAVAQFNASKEK